MQQNEVQLTSTDLMTRLANQHGIRLLSNQWTRPEFVGPEFKGSFSNTISDLDYHTDHSAVARGDVLAALKSPAHVAARRQEPYEAVSTNKVFRIGRAVHMLLLEPALFRKTFVIQPVFSGKTLDGRDSTQSKEAKLAKASWQATLPSSATVVTVEEMGMLFGMAKSIAANATAIALIEGAICENAVFFRDPVTGLKCRTKPDAINREMSAIIEVKTTISDLSEFAFQKAVWDHRYDIQLAMQSAAVKEVTGYQSETQVIIAMEKNPPYGCRVFELDLALRQRGCLDYQRGLGVIAASATSNEWPGYPETGNITIPKFAALTL